MKANRSRIWPTVATAILLTLGVGSVARASFFFNNLIPPPQVSVEKEIDPPVVVPPCTCPPLHESPEPATVVLATLSLAGVGAYRTLRRKIAA
jgi:hypothetical protein